jgi:hypothetical protein
VGIMCSLSIGLLGYFWGRRKIERSQYAMIIWTCVMHAGRPLVPITSSLPSALSCRFLSDGSGDTVVTPPTEDDDFISLEQECGKKAVNIPRQSRGLYFVSRSKRLAGSLTRPRLGCAT